MLQAVSPPSTAPPTSSRPYLGAAAAQGTAQLRLPPQLLLEVPLLQPPLRLLLRQPRLREGEGGEAGGQGDGTGRG